MKYLYLFIIVLIILNACQKEKNIDDSNLPYIPSATIIENPEDCIPIKANYRKGEIVYYIGNTFALLNELEDSLVQYLKENQDLVNRLNIKNKKIDILLYADTLLPYIDMLAFMVECREIGIRHVFFRTQTIDENIVGVKESVPYAFEEIHYDFTKRYNLKRKYSFGNHNGSMLEKVLIEQDTTSKNSFYTLDSELKIKLRPLRTIDVFAEKKDSLGQKLNPLLISLTENGFNYFDGKIIDNKDFVQLFKNKLLDIQQGKSNKTIVKSRKDNSKKADVYIIYSVEENIPYPKWLKTKIAINEIALDNDIDAVIVNSYPHELELIKEILKNTGFYLDSLQH